MHTGRVIAGLVPLMPRSLVWAVAKRYVAGPTLADALRIATALEQRGRLVTLDVLGEQFTSEAAVRAMVHAYDEALDALVAHPTATLSVMMTGFGMQIDPGACFENLRRLTSAAADRGIALTLNMEDSTTVDATLDIYRRLRSDGHANVGIVLQSCLRRTLDDIRALASLRPRVRVVKGIWREPESVAYLDPERIRTNYVAALEGVIGAGGYPEVATHDEWLIDRALELLRGADRARYEFQMLLGVRTKRGDALVGAGHRVRVYVPYGEDWYDYSVRRLRENPEMAQHIARDTVAAVFRRD